MGSGLVGLALQPEWSRITGNARVVLLAMAHSAYDRPRDGIPAATYWRGQDYLIAVIRGEIPDPGTAEYQAAEKAIGREIRKLVQAGAIERVTGAAGRRRSRYRLTLDHWPAASGHVDNPVDEDDTPEIAPHQMSG